MRAKMPKQMATHPTTYTGHRSTPGDPRAGEERPPGQAHGVPSSGSLRLASCAASVAPLKRAGMTSSHGNASQMPSRATAGLVRVRVRVRVRVEVRVRVRVKGER